MDNDSQNQRHWSPRQPSATYILQHHPRPRASWCISRKGYGLNSQVRIWWTLSIGHLQGKIKSHRSDVTILFCLFHYRDCKPSGHVSSREIALLTTGTVSGRCVYYFSHCCDQTLNRNNLCKKSYLLTHSLASSVRCDGECTMAGAVQSAMAGPYCSRLHHHSKKEAETSLAGSKAGL